MKRKLIGILGVGISVMAFQAEAANLVQVYYQALNSDPTFKVAESTWQSAKENLPIARSGVLPSFTATGSGDRTYVRNTPATIPNNNGYGWQYTYGLSLTQPIFNSTAWAAIAGASASVKAATATYAAAVQDLMVRTATAYFNVLKAYDRLRFTIANKRAVLRQLITQRQKFKVGLIAITGVYDAQSVYDQAVADEISDRNSLNNRIEDLRAITGKNYPNLRGLGKRLPLVKPLPNNINEWVRVAEMQNYNLRSRDFLAVQAREKIKEQAAKRWPVLSAGVNYNVVYNRVGGSQVVFQGAFTRTDSATRFGTLGFDLSFPFVQGGLVGALAQQARYNYLTAMNQLDFQDREVVKNTRQSFLSIIAGISRIKADIQSIKSAENAVKATQAGYIVGTRTMVDVLNDLSTLYLRKQQYANDQYDYILQFVALKNAAGTLSVQDLRQINDWLSKNVIFPISPEAYGLPESRGVKDPEDLRTMKGVATVPTNVGPDVDKSIDPLPEKLPQIDDTKPAEPSLKRVPEINTNLNTNTNTTTPSTDTTTPSTPSSKRKVKKQQHAKVVPLTLPQPATTARKALSKPVVMSKKAKPNRPWVKQARHDVYAIQVFASQSRQAAKHFVTKHPLRKFLHVTHQNKLHRVVFGHYQNARVAKSELKKLPQSLTKHHARVIRIAKAVSVKRHRDIKVAKRLPAPKKIAVAQLPAPSHTR